MRRPTLLCGDNKPAPSLIFRHLIPHKFCSGRDAKTKSRASPTSTSLSTSLKINESAFLKSEWELDRRNMQAWLEIFYPIPSTSQYDSAVDILVLIKTSYIILYKNQQKPTNEHPSQGGCRHEVSFNSEATNRHRGRTSSAAAARKCRRTGWPAHGTELLAHGVRRKTAPLLVEELRNNIKLVPLQEL